MKTFSAAALVLSFILAFALPPGTAFGGGNETNPSFSRAKRLLMRDVYSMVPRRTVYCGLPFGDNGRVALPESFDAPSPALYRRSGRVEWEHAVPVAMFGRTFSEWTEGHQSCIRKGRRFKGRNCAQKASREFALMQADMHNLFPSSGGVNAVRGTLDYGEVDFSVEPEFGSCKVKVDDGYVEPPDEAKGIVARASLYMAWAYPGRWRPTPAQKAVFERWDREHPVTPEECRRSRRISELQGNGNPFVEWKCGEF